VCYSVIFIEVVIRVADRADIKTGKPLLIHLQNVNNNNAYLLIYSMVQSPYFLRS